MGQGHHVLLVGATVEGFKVLRELARGKHHSVLLAEEVKGGMQLCLKTVAIPDGTESLGKVLEALADMKELQNARHPSLVRVFDTGTVEGDETGHLGYQAMELCTDGTLGELVTRAGAMNATTALKVLWQVAEATHALHEAGVIHGALTPGNILVAPHGRFVVTEPAPHRMHRALFGSAAARKPESLIYRAPEDATDVNLNRRADVYSLGGLLFFLLTGRHPPPVTAGGKSHVDLDDALMEGTTIPPAVRDVLRVAMAVDRGQRHDGVIRMVEALEEALSGPPREESTHVTQSVPVPLADAEGKVSTDEVDQPARPEPTVIAAPSPQQLKASEPTVVHAVVPPPARPAPEPGPDVTPSGPLPRALVEAAVPDEAPPEEDDPSTLSIPREALAAVAAETIARATAQESTQQIPVPLVATNSMVGLEPIEDPPPDPGFTDETPIIPMRPVVPDAASRVSSVPFIPVHSPPLVRMVPSAPPTVPVMPAFVAPPSPDVTAPIPPLVRTPPHTPPPVPATPPAQGQRARTQARPPTMGPTPAPQVFPCPGCGAVFQNAQALQTHGSQCPAMQLASMEPAPMLVGTVLPPLATPGVQAAQPQPQRPVEISARHTTAETRCRHCGIYFATLGELEAHLPRCSMKRMTFSTMGDAPLELARPDPLFNELDELTRQLRTLQNRAMGDMAGRGLEMLRDMVGLLLDTRVDDALNTAIRGRLLETGKRICILAQDTTPLGVRQMNAQLDLMVRMTIKLQQGTGDGVVAPGVLDAASRAVLEQGPVNMVKRPR